MACQAIRKMPTAITRRRPFFNVLAAYWIQFMTHDWFSHLEEGHNQAEYMKVGCETKLVNNVEQPLTPEDIAKLGCRPDDRMDKAYVAQDTPPGTFASGGHTYLDARTQDHEPTPTRPGGMPHSFTATMTALASG